MKQKTIITLVIILVIAGAISYGIIWYRNKKNSSSTDEKPDGGSDSGTTVKVPGTGSGYPLPKIETYAWWINKIGHAKFPLGMNSKGVEVLKVQEVLNAKGSAKGLSKITEDGIWGVNTDARFKQLFPNYTVVTQYMFITDFDPEGEILAKS